VRKSSAGAHLETSEKTAQLQPTLPMSNPSGIYPIDGV